MRAVVRRPAAPRAAAAVCAVVGVLDIVSLLVPPWHRGLAGLADWLPFDVVNAGSVAVAMAGILLLYLADGLARGKRRAWVVTLVVLVASTLARVAAGKMLLVVVPTLLLALLLVLQRHRFTATADRRTRRRGALVAAGAALLGMAVGLLLVQTRAREAVRGLPVGERLADVVLGMAGVPTSLDQGDTAAEDFVYFALLGLGLAVAIIVLRAVLAPARAAGPQTTAEGRRLRHLLADHGEGDSLGYFALHREKSLLFAADGSAVVAYRVVSGVMLASGDPVGDPAGWPDVVSRFVAEAHRNAWVPAVLGSSAEGAEVWRTAGGLESMDIGDEAVVDVATFALAGRAMRNVRQMVHRAQRRGWTVRTRRLGELGPADRRELAEAADRWRAGRVERGYSMALGRVGDLADSDCLVVTAHRGDELGGLLVLVPWGERGLSLDLMRRRGVDDAGVVELLVSHVLLHGSALGVDRVSLNFAAFRSVLCPAQARRFAPGLLVWRRTLQVADRWVQLESLHRFSGKFGPDWRPRYLLFPGVRDLPRVSVASLAAERFLVRPGWWRARPAAAAPPVRPRVAA